MVRVGLTPPITFLMGSFHVVPWDPAIITEVGLSQFKSKLLFGAWEARARCRLLAQSLRFDPDVRCAVAASFRFQLMEWLSITLWSIMCGWPTASPSQGLKCSRLLRKLQL
eukprot:TRINITY_DN3177_c0_g2_i4.p1 TRINITY_DN3177_c0_g2~~TRINITY_DN3177_c0_g2_i4.p1  ORF type:complete len:111 (-),score=6.48 TRINITY_DN3177_c0_g2_i4:11-343(-)